jgi:hypothetical protein
MGRPSRNANSNAQNDPDLNGENHGPSLEALVELIIRQLDSPARVMELYYWSREPQLLDIIRSVIAMPEQTREKLEAFLSMAGDPETITAALDNSGRLSLTSSHVTDALDLMREERVAMVPEIVHRTH